MTILQDFFVWWGQQLVQLLPDQLRRRNTAFADVLLIEPVGPLEPVDMDESAGLLMSAPRREEEVPVVELLVRRSGQISKLGRFALDGHGAMALQRAAAAVNAPLPIWLRLPPGLLLEKQLVLPLAAERELARVVGFEMDRETPFSADEVYWDSMVEQRDRPNARLKLLLSLVPKAPVQRLVAALQRAGMAPVALDAAMAQGGTRQIALAGAKRPRGVVLTRAVPAAGIACAALLLIAVIMPFIRQSIEFGAAEARVASLQPQVDEVENLRKRIEGSTAGRDILATERQRLGNALKVLSETTQVIPDDTYLTEFTMRQRKLTLGGQSAGAAKLINLLSQNPDFQNPTFAGVVLKLPNQPLEGFTISAEARQ